MIAKRSRKCGPQPPLRKRETSPKNKNALSYEKETGAFPIVGIGASAGGLEALEAFLSHVPPDSGMAFVVVQHLDPTRKGILTELLQRSTGMEVSQIKNGMKAEPEHVYVIPPNADLSILRGTFHLLKPLVSRGLRLPIDFFFRQLAEDQQDRGIGIILSGMGTDGTQGLKAIKEKMGMVMVQDPKSAKYDGMPRSAAETRLADYIAPVEELPGKLIEYVRHSAGIPVKERREEATASRVLDQIFLLLRSRTGNDFSLYKRSSIERRIERRMGIHQIEKMSGYLRYLQKNPAEIDLLFKELLIGVTSFFRDPEAFEILKKKLFPRLIKGKPKGSTIRVWVPGCSTGEEAYSLAIVLKECLEKAKLQGQYKVQIFASDIDKDLIEKARQGFFSAGIAADVSQKRLDAFFAKQDEGFQINKAIRDTILYSVQNILQDPPFTKLDLISCRNLLIYLTADLQKQLIPLFHYALNPSGILFLGSAETVGGFGNLFASLDKKWKLYQRKEEALPGAARHFGFPLVPSNRKIEAVEAAHKDLETLIPNLVNTALLNDFSPAAVLVNDTGDILYVSGRTGKYLEPPLGKANWNILAMAREGVRLEVGSALHRATVQKKQVTINDVVVKTNGKDQRINLIVKPLKSDKRELLLVVFEDIETPEGTPGKRKGQAKTDVPKFEREIQRMKERLNAALEENQVTQEEYRSANEELQSSNEELQSTNEELISSKEELQSVNEELMSVNTELQAKIDALLLAEDDMKNLLNSTGVATVFLDNNLNVRRFTPGATKIIRLAAADVGRPIADIVSNLKEDLLVENAGEVLEKLTNREMQAEAKDGKHYLMRMMPYRTANNAIGGVVMTFTEITALQKLAASLADASEYAESIVETVREPLVILNDELRIVSANASFYRTFRTSRKKTENKLIYDLGNRQWDIPDLRTLLETILPEKKEFEGFRVEHTFPEIGKRTMLLNARRLQRKATKEDLILLAIEDITNSDGSRDHDKTSIQ
jgi:two-component system CheB/CheR fusion protein